MSVSDIGIKPGKASIIALPVPPVVKKATAWQILGNACKKSSRHFFRVLMLVLLIIGLCTVFDETIGDGYLPQLNALNNPEFSVQARRNTTVQLKKGTQASYWKALAPTRELLTALSPEIAAWLYQLQKENRIQFTVPTENYRLYGFSEDDTTLVAAYRHLNRSLYIGPSFWSMSDGQKVTVLVHEYRHFRQNPPKRISRQLAQLLGTGRLNYDSAIEGEAFSYEHQAKEALGL